MAVRLRLSRFGRIHRPFYRIGAFDSRMRRDGAALEYLGYYDPLETTGQRLKINKVRIEHWLAQGATPSETVASFLREEEIAYKKSARDTSRNKVRAKKRVVARKKRTAAPSKPAKPARRKAGKKAKKA